MTVINKLNIFQQKLIAARKGAPIKLPEGEIDETRKLVEEVRAGLAPDQVVIVKVGAADFALHGTDFDDLYKPFAAFERAIKMFDRLYAPKEKLLFG